MKKMVLFRVNAGNEYGSGHLERCLVLARLLRKQYDPYFLVKGDNRIGEILYKENLNFKLAMHGFREEVDDIRGLRPNLVFLDVMETPIEFVRAIKEYAPVITLDDRGSGSEAATVTVYSLPLEKPKMSNIDSNKYIVFRPEIADYEKTRYERKIRRILVTFGGSDPANLSNVFVRISKLSDPKIEWVFVRGQFNQNRWSEGNYNELKHGINLFEQIVQADLVVTSFGMTAYESAAIGTPVILCNPGQYHENLSEVAGIFGRLGVYKPAGKDGSDNTSVLAREFSARIGDADQLMQQALQAREQVDKQGAGRMIELIESVLDTGRQEACVVCGSRRERALARDLEKNIFVCEKCGLFWQHWFTLPLFVYEKPYFGEDYAAQYGKTYLEDRENIDRLGKARLEVINGIQRKLEKKYPVTEKNLLDIGCAYGFFLDLARDLGGWTVKGIETSKIASKYARENLVLDVESGGFLDIDVPKEFYQAISLWYVIEHLPKLNDVVEKLYTSLARGGILALSTPNNAGFQGRYRRSEYLSQHPADHYFDFSIRTMKVLLKRYRFKVVKVRVTGIHYERFLKGREGSFWDNAFFRRCYGFLARVFGLGDTFEIYAVKK
ncbi:MAG TPA: methyltransferase domain-containing protein [Spirochaetota bacterium]|nr:methyltransferase domain-containing protein [Spirochaetota bacterium]